MSKSRVEVTEDSVLMEFFCEARKGDEAEFWRTIIEVPTEELEEYRRLKRRVYEIEDKWSQEAYEKKHGPEDG